METKLASKAEFAAMIKVSPGRVSQYIAEGKLGEKELEGQGRSAKVRVPEALAALKLRLDAGQMLGNGLGTKLNAVPAEQPKGQTVEDALDLQLKQARLEQVQSINARQKEEAKARAGVYVLAGDAKAQMAQIVGQMMQAFEGGLTDIATAIAAQYKLPARDVIHMARGQDREMRLRMAEKLRTDAKLHPEQMEDTDIEH